jgi:hypothetical protein
MHALDATADQITSVDWRRSKWHSGPLLAGGHEDPTLRGKLPLCMACVPCTASTSHAAWDVDGRDRFTK